METIVQELLDNDFNQPLKFPYSSPIVSTRKKIYRLCADYRRLNSLSLKDRFPLPGFEIMFAKTG